MASLSNSAADAQEGKQIMVTVGVSVSIGIFMVNFLSGASPSADPNDGFYWVAPGF
jgi:hypothetical protein